MENDEYRAERQKIKRDLISRQAAIDFIKSEQCNQCSDIGFCGYCAVLVAIRLIEKVSSVQPEQKTARWIYKERNALINTNHVSYGENGAVQEKRWIKVKKPYCSGCGWYENNEHEATPYCPNCGAFMKGDNNDSRRS